MGGRLRSTFRWLAAGLVSLAVVAVVILGGSTLWFGSARAAQAYLRGQVLLVDQAEQAVGTIPLGEKRPADFAVRNLTSRSVTVIGATSTCTCSVPEDLPLTIPFGQSRTLRFQVGATGKVGPFQQTFELFLNVPSPPVVLTASGEAAGPPQHAEGEPILEPIPR